MKKFTKGCLITALVLFIFGCAFYGICGFMGGFRQLKERNIMRSNGVFSIGIPGFEWGFDGQLFTFWDDDWDDWGADMSSAVNLVEIEENAKTAYAASDMKGIEIELGGCNLVIVESPDEFIWVENRSNVKTVKYGMKNGIFKLYNGKSFRFWNNMPRGSVYLYLPKGMVLSTIDIEMGAGNLESIALAADDIDLEAGAGSFEIEGLSGNEADIVTGAGSITVGKADIRELNMEAAAGAIEVTGSVSGNVDIDCAAGSIDLILDAEEADFDYEIECSVGGVTINGNEYTGLATERSVDNGAMKEMNIECAAGSVVVEFIR